MIPGNFFSTFEFMRDAHFLRPLWLLALPVLWGIVFWLAKQRHRRQDWSRIIDAELMPSLRLAAGGARAGTPWPWLTLAWTLGAIALAGPTWQRIQTAAFRAPSAWAIVLDLSPSMDSADLTPNRYTRARYAIDDLLGTAHDARVGLVVFGEEPFTVTPLTSDVATVKAMLPPLAPDIMPSAGDHLAPAIDQAVKLVEQVSAKDRHVVVLTDGFDDPAAALSAVSALKTKGIALSVVGIGTTTGAPLRSSDGHFSQNANGHTQMSRLDVDRLRQLATVGGGHYFELSQIQGLAASLSTAPRMPGEETTAAGIEVAHWLDGGVWLLPILLVLAAFLARRGWL